MGVSSSPPGLSLEDVPGPACVLEAPDGRVGSHNVAFAQWVGLRDPTGLALADLFPGDTGAARLWHEALALGAAEHNVERRGDDVTSFFSLRARRAAAGVVVIAGDVTAVAEAAQAIHAAERDYVSVAAHELRAPLAAIKAWASALDARRPDRDADGEGLGAIARQVDRMNDLLTDLLDAARAGAGVIRADRAHVAVDALVQRAVLAYPSAKVVRAPLGERVVVDAAQIEALIARLVGWIAARQPDAPIAVEASREGGEIHVLVDDPSPELAPRADVDRFGRGARSGRGRGLGLYLCQHLAAVNGGRVFHERTSSSARFVVTLPIDRDPPRARHAPARVLFADAEASRVARALAVLRLEGFEVTGAVHASDLFARLEEGAFDVVVADVLMPGVGGLAAVARVRERRPPPSFVIVAPSAERPPALEGAERAGALAVLPRPLDWPHLVSLIGCAAR